LIQRSYYVISAWFLSLSNDFCGIFCWKFTCNKRSPFGTFHAPGAFITNCVLGTISYTVVLTNLTCIHALCLIFCKNNIAIMTVYHNIEWIIVMIDHIYVALYTIKDHLKAFRPSLRFLQESSELCCFIVWCYGAQLNQHLECDIPLNSSPLHHRVVKQAR
jgi:hypothetical protein